MTRDGIACEIRGQSIMLDPKRTDEGALNFVSHAHADHLPANGGGLILASQQTRRIASLRGLEMENHTEYADGVEMTQSGHILGSRGLLAGGLFYTGDICGRSRGFLPAAHIPKCDILITECTFGLPEFSFPDVSDVAARTNEIISAMYSRGKPVVLMGYQLGKAQTLSDLFGHWRPLIYHDSIKAMNTLHCKLGVSLPDAPGYTEAESAGILDRAPWVMIAPMMPARSEFIRGLKSRYGAVTIGFSGWAAAPRFPMGRTCDYMMTLSDHCDYKELLTLVRQTGAAKVYTVHGFTAEFAASLRKTGIDAQPLV